MDKDSEGLLLLTDDGKLNHLPDKTQNQNLTRLIWFKWRENFRQKRKSCKGLLLKDGKTLPAKVKLIDEPDWLWERTPPIRERKAIPTNWVEISIKEGKNRQIRRMTATVGFPTLRLIRWSIGQYSLGNLKSGEYKIIQK